MAQRGVVAATSELEFCQQAMRRLMLQRAVWEGVLLEGAPLLKGSVVQQYKQCGKKNCSCAAGAHRHGPFTYLSISDRGRTRMRFVRDAQRGRVVSLAENYRRFRHARAQVVKLNREIMDLTNRIERLRTVDSNEAFS